MTESYQGNDNSVLLFPKKKSSLAPPAAIPMATAKGQEEAGSAPDLVASMQAINEQAEAIRDLCQSFLAQADRRRQPEITSLASRLSGPILELERLAVDVAHATQTSVGDLWDSMPAAPLAAAQSPLVDVRVEPDRIFVRMPLLPPRDAGGLSELGAANTALMAKLMAYDLPKWEKWQASFCHTFPSDFPTSPKDVDNFSYKRTLDVLALMLGQSDSAEVCTVLQSCRIDDSMPPGTYIEITEKSSDFPQVNFPQF